MLFISGQIPESSSGVVPPDFKSQARLVWSNLLAQLAAAGMSIRNLVKVTMFLSSRAYTDENREVRQEALGDHAPALTVIITGIFDEPVAARDQGGRGGVTPSARTAIR